MSTKKHINDLHAEIKEWQSQVSLTMDEIKAFKKQLGEIVSKNTEPEAVAKAEHFENQFRHQLEIFDDLSDELALADEALGNSVKNNGSADHVLFDDQPVLRDKAQTSVHIFTELKNEFRAYEQQWF